MFTLLFFLVVVFFAFANFYIYKRFILINSILKPYKNIFLYLLIMLFIGEFLFFLFRKNDNLNDDLYCILAAFFAISYCFFIIIFLFDLFKFLFKFKNNLFLDIFVLFLCVFNSIFGIYSALKTPNITNHTIEIKNLNKDLKIAVLSDIHLGKNLHEDFLEKLIKKTNKENVDFVFILGDLIDANVSKIKPYINKINDFKSTYGTYYVLGNHEYYHDANEVVKLLKENTNLNILINKNKKLDFINISGLADLQGNKFGIIKPNIEKINQNLNKDLPSILLVHQPKAVKIYNLNNFDLILSGHTHGGQVFPFNMLVFLNQGFVYGLYNINEKSNLYVSSGAGFWGIALRFLSPNEIGIFYLKGKK